MLGASVQASPEVAITYGATVFVTLGAPSPPPRSPCASGGAGCLPPKGFKAPTLIGAHFSASNPSKAVILTFDAPTNEGGALCLGYCPCAALLDQETVRKLQGDEEFEPYCEWLGPDALRADVLSSSTLTKLVDKLGIKPQAIHPQDWPSEDWACDDVDPPVCARASGGVGSLVVTVPSMACDDARTVAMEPCAKPRADVIMSPSALTACPSAVELLGSGEYPDGETSVRPLVFKWEMSSDTCLGSGCSETGTSAKQELALELSKQQGEMRVLVPKEAFGAVTLSKTYRFS